MTLPSPDISLDATLKRLSVLKRDWPGEIVTPEGTLHVQNGDGDSPPIYWCFNGTQEFASLGAIIGPRRPLAGMRSLHQILTLTSLNMHVIDELATHYADGLLRRFGARPCIVGGNCQSAAIAWRVAVRLMAAGVPIIRLVTIDAELRLPFPGRMRLLFGAESQHHNPFLRGPEDPARPMPWHWDRAWTAHETVIVPGPHGAYFTPGHLPDVAAAIVRDDPPRELPPPPPTIPLSWRPLEGTQARLEIEATPPEGFSPPDDLSIMALMRNHKGAWTYVPGPDWIVPVQVGPTWRCRLPIDRRVPTHFIVPVLCAPALGPLQWPLSSVAPLQAA